MKIKKNVAMIGEFTDRGPRLFSEKAAGNICGCIGFVKDPDEENYACEMQSHNHLKRIDIFHQI